MTHIAPVAAYQPQQTGTHQAYQLNQTRFGRNTIQPNTQRMNWLQPPTEDTWEPIDGRDLFLMVYPEARAYNNYQEPKTMGQHVKALFRNFMHFTP